MSTPLLDEAAARLRTAGIESPRLEARLLLAHAMGVAADVLISSTPPHRLAALGCLSPSGGEATNPLSPTGGEGQGEGAAETFTQLLRRRISGEPLAYIVGHKEFWSLEFAVGPGVLVPRPETETLVEEALRLFEDRDGLNVLDLGTGSGCLLLAFLSERPRARGLGVDASADALRYAHANAVRLGLGTCAAFEQRDWANGIDGRFDVILVNPPYLTDAELASAPPELRAEPPAALAAGADGLAANRVLAPQIARLLAPRGRAFVELGQGQADACSRLFSSAGLETVALVPDLSGIPRCLVLAA